MDEEQVEEVERLVKLHLIVGVETKKILDFKATNDKVSDVKAFHEHLNQAQSRAEVEATLGDGACDTRLGNYYERVSTRRGHHKAVVAMPGEMLTIIWHMLKNNELYRGENRRLTEQKQENEEANLRNGLVGQLVTWREVPGRFSWMPLSSGLMEDIIRQYSVSSSGNTVELGWESEAEGVEG